MEHITALDEIVDLPATDAWRRLVRDTKTTRKMPAREFGPSVGWHSFEEADRLSSEAQKAEEKAAG